MKIMKIDEAIGLMETGRICVCHLSDIKYKVTGKDLELYYLNESSGEWDKSSKDIAMLKAGWSLYDAGLSDRVNKANKFRSDTLVCSVEAIDAFIKAVLEDPVFIKLAKGATVNFVYQTHIRKSYAM